MTYHTILIAALWLLLAFSVERLGKAWGVPSVVFLILAGQISHPILGSFGVNLSGLDAAVPVIGSIGLVLIVLEGAFDIELRKDRLGLATRAFASALTGLLACMSIFGLLAAFGLQLTWMHAFIAAVPLSVISSAVAIPSSALLPSQAKEFVLYESAISDILGILVFFTLLNSDGSLSGVVHGFLGAGALSLLLGSVSALLLIWILLRLEGHIRFIPLLAGLFALYAAGKLWHLSPLLMVLLFGLAINNVPLLARISGLRWLADERHGATLREFKLLAAELTFAVRGFFFILLGYWTDLSTLADPLAWMTAAVALAVIYGSRYLLLRLLRIPLSDALVWMAPRGLITVLLFLTAKETMALPAFLDGAVLLVVFSSAIAVVKSRKNALNVSA